MTYLILGILIFFGTHFYSAFRSRAPGKDLKVRMGAGPYMGLYSLAAIAGFALMVWGYGQARGAGGLGYPPTGLRHLVLALMPFAMIALVAAYAPTGYIKKTLKHPMLVAVKIWAVAHLLANWEWNSIFLFGSFLAYGVIDRIALKKRGDNGPPADAPVNVMGDVAAVVIGLGAYAALLLWLHPVLFGVAVMPG
jgi:uncharacterized membrane protein